VEPGNDPGRDEYGLPPVDIQIPDDARDLDRDVQAYYRELRARRRRVRVRRLTGPLTRHGMVLPLVAACLALTLLTGSLLTVLSGRQIPLMRNRLSPGPTQGVPSSGRRQLPSASVYRPRYRREVQLSSLAPAVLAWVPSGCVGCGRVLRQLASRAATARVPIYFVGYDPTITNLTMLVNQLGHRYSRYIINDTNNVLGTTYQLADTYQASGVTVILAHNGGSVAGADVVHRVSSPEGLKTFEARLAVLASVSAGATAGSSGSPQHPAPQAS